MGRESKNKQQKCEEFNPNVAEPEPQQEDPEPEPQQEDAEPEPEPEYPEPEPEYPEPEQADPEPQQTDLEPDPEPQQAEPDPEPQQIDEISADSQVDPSHEDEIQQDPQVHPVPDQDPEDEIVHGDLNIQAEAQQEVLSEEPEVEDQEGVLPVSQESSEEEGETETEDPPTPQESSEQGVEPKTGDIPVSKESSEREVGRVGIAPTSQKCPELEGESQVRVPPVSQESAELEVGTRIEVSPDSQVCPEQLKTDSAEIQEGDDNSVLRIPLKQEMEANVQQEQVRLFDENLAPGNEIYSNIVPMISGILRPIFDEAGSEILQQMHQRHNVVPMIYTFLQQILEAARSEILEQTNQNIEPVPSELLTSSEEAGSEIAQQRHQIIVPATATLRPWREILQQMRSVLSICFEILQPSREDFRPEILFQTLFLTFEHRRFIVSNLIDPTVIMHREYSTYHRIQILQLLFSIHFRTMPRLLPVEPLIPLSALVESAPLSALRVLRDLLDLAEISNLEALEGPDLPWVETTQRLSSLRHFPLSPFPESPNVSSSSEPRPNLSEAAMCSNLIYIDPTFIIQREFTTYHRIQILPLLFSIQFRTMPRLLPVEPLISLLALVLSDPLLALRGLRHLLGMVDISDFPALEGPDMPAVEPTQSLSSLGHFPFLSIPVSLPLGSFSEPRPNLSEAEMLQKRKDIDQDLSELSSVHHSEAVEALAVCPRKPMKARAKKRRKESESSKLEFENQQIEDPGDPDIPDPRELQNLLEIENGVIADPGEPDIPDPTDLFKDLNFQEMKGDSKETEHTVILELDPIKGRETESENDLKTEASEDLETEVTEDDGDLNTEASEDLETEVTEDDADLITEASEEFKTKAKGDLETNDDEDLETSDDKDLEMSEDLKSDEEGLETDNDVDVGVEECQLLLPHEEQLPRENIVDPYEDIIDIPDDAEEDASSGDVPNDEGNSVCICPETCHEGEARLEERLDEAGNPFGNVYHVACFCMAILFFVFTSIVIYFILTNDGSGSNTNPPLPVPSLTPGNFHKKHN